MLVDAIEINAMVEDLREKNTKYHGEQLETGQGWWKTPITSDTVGKKDLPVSVPNQISKRSLTDSVPKEKNRSVGCEDGMGSGRCLEGSYFTVDEQEL